ncbi:MAG: bifunctional 3-(3-hydroxy-phenyl)propionate/3-hydroxycinnamic acid hydroxylase [Caulobacteraceae bacterium]
MRRGGDAVTDRKRCQVLIVGLGPVGETLAAFLADAGVQVLAIDKSTEVYPLPRAAHFDDEIMRIFQQLGVADTVLPHTRVAASYEFRNGKGEVLLSLPHAERLTPAGWAPSYMFNQPGLEHALREKLAAASSVEILLGAEFKSLRTSDEGVQATVATPSGELVVDADYLVGCDGASSPVREGLGIKLANLQFDEPWLVIDALPRPGCRLPDINLQICDPARPTTCVLMGPGRHRWEFMMLPGETAEQMLDDAFIHELLVPWGVDVEIDRKAVYRFHGLVAERWREGRVLIAGDAAHQTPPFAGQGMCAGIRDAANLSWKLTDVLSGRAGPELLDTYQIEREPNVRAYIELAIAMGRVVCTLDPEVAHARDEEMLAARASGAQAISPARPPPLSGPAILEGTPGAGQAFPQPTQDDGGRLARMDDSLGPGPWLISSIPTTLPPDSGIAAITLDEPRLAPFRTGVADWLADQGADAVLVRPDRCVFGAGRPTALLAAWASALGAADQTSDRQPTHA